MDFSFTPEQDELRAQARSFLAANPRAVVAGAGGARLDRRVGCGGGRRRRPRVPRGSDPVRGDGARAHACAVLVDRRGRSCPALPPDLQGEVAHGEASWTLATGPLVADLDSATRVAVIGGDSIWELEGAEREVLQTNDETRPLGVVSGGTAGRRLASSELLPRAPRPLAHGARARGVRRGRAGARARRRLREGARSSSASRSAPTRRSRTRSRRR